MNRMGSVIRVFIFALLAVSVFATPLERIRRQAKIGGTPITKATGFIAHPASSGQESGDTTIIHQYLPGTAAEEPSPEQSQSNNNNQMTYPMPIPIMIPIPQQQSQQPIILPCQQQDQIPPQIPGLIGPIPINVGTVPTNGFQTGVTGGFPQTGIIAIPTTGLTGFPATGLNGFNGLTAINPITGLPNILTVPFPTDTLANGVPLPPSSGSFPRVGYQRADNSGASQSSV